MATRIHGKLIFEVDDEGFLAHPESWSEEVAVALASAEGITEVTAEHWKIIRYLRAHYVKFGVAPMVRDLCKGTGIPLKRLYELFHKGPAKGACKVAGLPDEAGCV